MAACKILVRLLVGLVLLQVAFGGVFRREAASGGRDTDDSFEKMLERKLQISFNVFDLNHDKIVNKEDLSINQNVFINVYNLTGSEETSLKQKLYDLWSCFTMNKLDEGLSKEQFVARLLQASKQTKLGAKLYIQHCDDLIVDVLDYDKNGIMSIDELAVVYTSFNKGNKKLTEIMYNMLCSNTPNSCPIEAFSDYWTERLLGDDKGLFEFSAFVWKEVGMPFDEFVE